MNFVPDLVIFLTRDRYLRFWHGFCEFSSSLCILTFDSRGSTERHRVDCLFSAGLSNFITSMQGPSFSFQKKGCVDFFFSKKKKKKLEIIEVSEPLPGVMIRRRRRRRTNEPRRNIFDADNPPFAKLRR